MGGRNGQCDCEEGVQEWEIRDVDLQGVLGSEAQRPGNLRGEGSVLDSGGMVNQMRAVPVSS